MFHKDVFVFVENKFAAAAAVEIKKAEVEHLLSKESDSPRAIRVPFSEVNTIMGITMLVRKKAPSNKLVS